MSQTDSQVGLRCFPVVNVVNVCNLRAIVPAVQSLELTSRLGLSKFLCVLFFSHTIYTVGEINLFTVTVMTVNAAHNVA